MNVNEILTEEEVYILVVGNNPTELSHVFESLKDIQGKRIITEIAFDFKSIFERLVNFSPEYILMDDNIGKPELKLAVKALLKFKKTKEIPITILKNSNYDEAINTGIMNYILKKDLTGESLYRALKNSIKSKITQQNLMEAYKKRKGKSKGFLK